MWAQNHGKALRNGVLSSKPFVDEEGRVVVQWDDDGKTFRWQVPHLIAEDLKDGVLDVVATSTRLPAAKKKGITV